jgi:hypothetical protein
MVLDYVALNIDATVTVMKEFITTHQDRLLIRNYADFASVTALMSCEYSRLNVWRWLWMIGQAFTTIYPLPLSGGDEKLIEQLEKLNEFHYYRKMEINIERRELQCVTTGRVFKSGFDCWMERSPLAAKLA